MHLLFFITPARFASVGVAAFRFPFCRLPPVPAAAPPHARAAQIFK
ncbi:hypothetical protein [Methanimicrococcus hacksteinii]|nr:hypothetical protein [Methanimicrococcus sp. At1]